MSVMSHKSFDINSAQSAGVSWHDKLKVFKDTGLDLSEPSLQELEDKKLFNAKFGNISGAHTAEASEKNKDKINARNNATVRQMSSSAAAQISASQSLLSSVTSIVSQEMHAVRTNIQVAETKLEQDVEQLADKENVLEAADELVVDEQQDVIEATAQRDIRAQGHEGTEQVFDNAADQYKAAEIAGDTAAMEAAARGMMQSSGQSANLERLTAESEIEVAEETQELAQAVEMRASVQEQIDVISKEIAEGNTNAEQLRTQLGELTEFNTYLNSDEAQELAASGDLTMETLQANGMPESVRIKMEEDLSAPASSPREVTSSVDGGVGTGLSSKASFATAADGASSITPPLQGMTPPAIPLSAPAPL